MAAPTARKLLKTGPDQAKGNNPFRWKAPPLQQVPRPNPFKWRSLREQAAEPAQAVSPSSQTIVQGEHPVEPPCCPGPPATAHSGLKSIDGPEPSIEETEDDASQISADLAVADTPTSIQQQLGSPDSDDDSVEVLEGPFLPREPPTAAPSARRGKGRRVAPPVASRPIRGDETYVGEQRLRGAKGEISFGRDPAPTEYIASDRESTDEAPMVPSPTAGKIKARARTREGVKSFLRDLRLMDGIEVPRGMANAEGSGDIPWTIGASSHAAYHLVNAATQVRHDYNRNLKLARRLMELDLMLMGAEDHAQDVLNLLKGGQGIRGVD